MRRDRTVWIPPLLALAAALLILSGLLELPAAVFRPVATVLGLALLLLTLLWKRSQERRESEFANMA